MTEEKRYLVRAVFSGSFVLVSAKDPAEACLKAQELGLGKSATNVYECRLVEQFGMRDGKPSSFFEGDLTGGWSKVGSWDYEEGIRFETGGPERCLSMVVWQKREGDK